MTITSGFFNATEGTQDRAYSAEDINKLVGSLLIDGVIPYAGNFLVEENGDMTVKVQPGRAWFNNRWVDSDAVEVLPVEASNAAYRRYDLVVLEFDLRDSVRAVILKILKGVADANPSDPTLLVDDDHMEIPIARLTIEPSSTDIPQTKIENLVGTTACPIASGILEQVTTDNLVAQWDAQFNTWFNNLVSELDTNQATNLQNQINDIGDRLSMLGRNILINGDMQVSQRGDGPYLMSGNYYTYSLLGPDLWRPGLTDSGSWNFGTVDYIHNGVTKKWLRLDCAVAKTTLTAASSFWVHQRIEGYRVEAARFGDPANAKPLTLSFLFRASKSGTYVVELLQIGATENTTVSRSFVYTTPGAIQKVTLTYPPNTITALTRPWNEENLRVGFYVSAGSNLASSALNDSWIGSNAGVTGRATGQVNLADTVNAYAMWTDIQLEIGSDATPYDRFSYGDSLRACQRYYYGIASTGESRRITVYSTGGKDHAHFDWPVQMRTTPLVYFVWLQQLVGSGWNFYCTNEFGREQITEYHTKTQFAYRTVGSSQGSAGYSYMCEMTYLSASAEL